MLDRPVQRLRELMAHGGIAILAVVFALAFAAFQLANSIAQTALFAVQQHAGEGFELIDFTIFETRIQLDAVVQALLSVVLIAAAWLAVWLLTRASVRKCPECRSQIDREASICRYCTTELTSEGA